MLVGRRRSTRLVLFSLLCAACGGSDSGPRIEPMFDPSPIPYRDVNVFFSFPFPSDHMRVDGSIDLSMYPYPVLEGGIANQYIAAASTLDGFSTSASSYVRFTGPIDTTTLLTDPAAYLDAGAPLAIVDITEGSHEYGARRPLRTQWWDESTRGTYVAPNMLAIAPAWGFPLREHTTYATLVMKSVGGANGVPLEAPKLLTALLRDRPRRPSTTPPIDAATFAALHAQYAPLRAWLTSSGTDPESIASASVFTTQTITRELDQIYAQIENELPAPAMNDAGWQTLDADATPYTFSESYEFRVGEAATYNVFEGRYLAPNYQEGTIPYMSEGGRLHFVNGEPEPVFDETIRFVLTVPTTPPAEGLDCYPIVMYAHGTGGSANSMRNDDTAGRLAGRGIAAISIDQPLHGFRDQGQSFNVDLLSFNFFNADAFRANFRQAAIDTFSLTRFVKESLRVPASVSPTGSQIDFCEDRVAFFGHSHGGLSGALALPFEADVDDWVLSGAGGGFGITLLERKDILDFANVVRVFLAVTPTEGFSELHPSILLLQTLADISDPVNYAERWNTRPVGRAPASVLLTSGQHDEATPYRTAIALAVSGGLPVVEPIVVPAPELDWLGLTTTSPVTANAGGETLGFLQWTNDLPGTDFDTHFVIFNRPEAIEAGNHFLETALYDFESTAPNRVPTILRDPASDAL